MTDVLPMILKIPIFRIWPEVKLNKATLVAAEKQLSQANLAILIIAEPTFTVV